MKKYIYTLIAAVAMLSLAGCSLEEYNPSSASADSEWTTLAGFEKKVNDCYFDFIRIVYGQAEDVFVPLSECGTDLWGYTKDVNANSSNGWCQVATYTSFGASNGQLAEAYSGFYGTLSACNGAIAYASKVQRASEEAVNALVAEAHYLRAHALFNIVEFWGGKYLPTGLLEEALINLPSSSVNDFYDVILADLEFAMKYLPVKQEVRGHVTRAAAYHLYAKACPTGWPEPLRLRRPRARTSSRRPRLRQTILSTTQPLLVSAFTATSKTCSPTRTTRTTRKHYS